MDSTVDVRALLERCEENPGAVYLDAAVDGIITTFLLMGREAVGVIVSEEAAPYIAMPGSLPDLARVAGEMNGMIGVFHRGSAGQVEYTPRRFASGDTRLDAFLGRAADHFLHCVDGFGAWPSLASFLHDHVSYEVDSERPETQVPMDYWWLTGSLDQEGPIHPCTIYEEDGDGLFIRPGDGLLPLFSSPLYAAMAARLYSDWYGVEVSPSQIPCPGCFFTGFSGEAGRENLRGALFNERWKVEFFTCRESPSHRQSKHYLVRDFDGREYALAGCADRGTGALWCERSWDRDGRWFSASCGPLPW